jgi:RNA polymerase-binding transcription factor DksA
MQGDLSEFRAALEQQRLLRSQQISELAGRALPEEAIDEPQSEVSNALRAAARNALSDIEAALARLDEGAYGVCSRCRTVIPRERLEVLPMAALCMGCAREHGRRTG